MKIQYKKFNQDGASVLLITLGICTILGILMLSYLSMAKTQAFSVARAQAWNYALVVAEAGVEEGMAEISDTMAFKNFTTLPGNQWTPLGGGTICKTNIYLGGSNYYNVFIYSQPNASLAPTADTLHPVIIATGYVAGPISSPVLSRTVRVQAAPITQLVPPGAMVASTTVNFNGYNISTDSFQSTNTALFPGGQWNVTNRRDHGDVSTLDTNSADISVQNGKVRGTLHTPPNWTATTFNSVGSGGSVGDNAWVSGGSTGLETGHAINDATQTYPDATLPDTGGAIWRTATPGSTVINGVTYQYVLTTNSPWIINNLSGANIYVKGPNVQLQLTGSSASVGNLTIPQLNDSQGNPYSLDMYVSAPTFSVTGTSVANAGGLARNFQYYGLPSNTAISIGGNGSIVAQIYAPEAAFSLGGGGSNTYDYSGMCVVKSVKMNGHFNFHFDENTLDTLHLRGYTAHSWDEL